MNVWLYRRRLSLGSGARQLLKMQAEGLERAGIRPTLAAERRRFKYFLRTGRRIEHLPLARARELAGSGRVVFVDHSARVPEAGIVFVHSLWRAAAERLPTLGCRGAVAEEAAFFRELGRDSLIARVQVLHPGFRTHR